MMRINAAVRNFYFQEKKKQLNYRWQVYFIALGNFHPFQHCHQFGALASLRNPFCPFSFSYFSFFFNAILACNIVLCIRLVYRFLKINDKITSNGQFTIGKQNFSPSVLSFLCTTSPLLSPNCHQNLFEVPLPPTPRQNPNKMRLTFRKTLLCMFKITVNLIRRNSN